MFQGLGCSGRDGAERGTLEADNSLGTEGKGSFSDSGSEYVKPFLCGKFSFRVGKTVLYHSTPWNSDP